MTEIVFPGTFEQALNSPDIKPGDRLLLKSGIYVGDWTINVGGAKNNSIIIQPYQNEMVIIDGTIIFNKPYIILKDLEIIDSNLDRTQPTIAITMNQIGAELIGCHIHHMRSSVFWFGSGAGRIAECWMHDNGYTDLDGMGHGYAIYTHNNVGGERRIERNLFGNEVGKYAYQLYSGGANWIQDYFIADNVTDGDPIHIGGGLGLKNINFSTNILNGDYFQFGYYSQHNYDMTITDNLFIDAAVYNDPNLPFDVLTESGNVSYGGSHPARVGYTTETKPQEWSRFIPFSLSSRWSGIRATITGGVFSAAMVAL